MNANQRKSARESLASGQPSKMKSCSAYSRSSAFIRGHLLFVALLSASFAALTPSLVRADALDEIQKRGKLIWGGDQEGGAPFVFPDPKDPNHLIGFEVDLAEMLAKELGVTAQFQQGQWEKIPRDDWQPNRRCPQRLRTHGTTDARQPLHASLLCFWLAVDGPPRQSH